MSSGASASIAILADDLTGAADCAVAFSRSGHRALVEIDGEVVAHPGVTAYSSDTRDRDEADAVGRVEYLTEAIAHAGFSHAYKKVDSLVRGHVAAELRVMLSVLDGPVAVVAPAFPSHGHGVLGGRLTSPTRSVDLLQLLRSRLGSGVGHVSLAQLEAGGLAERIATAAPGSTLVCDAASDADLERIVETAEVPERPVLFVGSAGLAAPLGAHLGPPAAPVAVVDLERVHVELRHVERVVVVVGSATALAHRQIGFLVRSRDDLEWFELSPGDLIASGVQRCTAILTRIAAALERGAIPILSITALAEDRGVEGRQIADGLGRLLLGAGELGGLVITGGDTARAVLASLGVSGFLLLGEVEPGVVRARAQGSVGIETVLKSGGFGDEATLVRCVEALRP